MRAFVFALIFALSFSFAVMAQDTLVLTSGKKVRGDVVAETEESVEVLLRDGTLKTFTMREVDEVKKRPMKKEIIAQLSGESRDSEMIMSVVAKFADEKKFKKDCQRLAKRAVAFDPECVAARKFLDHVRYDGRWYTTAKEADKAMAQKMKTEGRVFFKGAWVHKTEKRDLQKSPGDFMLDGQGRWRIVKDLMAEKNYIKWGSEWYPPEEKTLVERLRAISNILKKPCQGAVNGPTCVVDSGSRERAQRLLKKMADLREWFDLTMKPKGQSFSLGPQSLIVVLQDRNEYETFLKGGSGFHKAPSERVSFAIKRDSMSFDELSRVSNRTEAVWEHTIISGTGATMMRLMGNETYPDPPALYVAAGHLAELKFLGSVRIHFAKVSNYDQGQKPDRKYRSLGEAKSIVDNAIRTNRVLSIAKLFRTSVGGLTYLHEAQGIFLLQYLSEKHSDGLRTFVSGRNKSGLEGRFKDAFKLDMTAMDKKFLEWFESQR